MKEWLNLKIFFENPIIEKNKYFERCELLICAINETKNMYIFPYTVKI